MQAGNLITSVSVIIIICIFLYLMFLLKKQKRQGTLLANKRWVNQFPSLISTLGVLGTFAGITYGLVHFDTSDLDNSIPILLEGMKTAFYTSLAGMTGSLILSKVINTTFDKLDSGLSDINVASMEICKSVKEMSSDIRQIIATLLNHEEDSTKSQAAFYWSAGELLSDIKSNTDSVKASYEIIGSIHRLLENNVSEITKLSTVISDRSESIKDKMDDTNALLSEKFNEFAVLLKKSNTEALVEVMKTVTQSFQEQMNAIISRLVQENFEQLNKSVENLNIWQHENKAMISSLTIQYKKMSDEFGATSGVLSQVSSDTRTLVSEGGKLNQLINTLSKVIINDDKFTEITSELSRTVTITKENMVKFDESTHALNEWIKKQRDFVDGVQLLIDKLDEINKINDYNEKFWQGTKRSLEEGVGIITKGTQSLQSQLTNLDEQFYARLSTTLAELDTCIQSMVKHN